jgi:hypothetical protein
LRVLVFMATWAMRSVSTGTFGLSNDTIRTIYTILATVALPFLKVVLGKYWGPISKILEILKIKTPIVESSTSTDIKEAVNSALALLVTVCSDAGCKEGIDKVGDLFTHVHELIFKMENEPKPEPEPEPEPKK